MEQKNSVLTKHLQNTKIIYQRQGKTVDKVIRWDEAKNQLLQLQRGVSFEEVLDHIEQGTVLNRLIPPNREKYPHQEIFVVEMKSYIWYIPFVENESEIFLKIIIPSRKLVKQFGGKKQ